MAVFTELTPEIREAEPDGVMLCVVCKDEVGLGDLFVKTTAISRPKVNDTPRMVCASCALEHVQQRIEDLDKRLQAQRTFLVQINREIADHQ